MKIFEHKSLSRLTQTARLTIAAAAIVVAMVGCRDRNMHGQGKGEGDEVEVNLSVDVQGDWGNGEQTSQAASRAVLTGANFPYSSGGTISNIGLFLFKLDGDVVDDKQNMTMELTGKSGPVYTKRFKDNYADAPWTAKLSYVGTPAVNLSGYYPRVDDVAVTATSVPFDLGDVQEAEMADFLYCSPQEVTMATASNVKMTFKHVFAMMEFRVKTRNYVSTIKGEKVNVYDHHYVASKGTFNPETGAVSMVGAANTQDVCFYYTTGNVINGTDYTPFRVVVPPLTLPDDYNPANEPDKGIKVMFTLEGGGTASFIVKKEYLSDGKSLDAGKKYSFNLILDGSAKGELQVESWTISEDVQGDVGSLPQSVMIDGTEWATGNLVADASVTPGTGVATDTKGTKVKIGKPTDGGLYFQFGSLIGYKGGNTASQGRGVGIPHGATTATAFPDGKYWNQATAYSWANDAMVWPQAYTNGAATWPYNLTTNSYYFGLNSYATQKAKLSAFPGWEDGTLVSTSVAVGDPCRYYLGGAWRTPTAEDWSKLLNNQTAASAPGATTKTYNAGITDSNSPTEGVGLYANTLATTAAAAQADPNALFFPASGYRHSSTGSFYGVGRSGYFWSGSVYTATHGFYLYFTTTYVNPQSSSTRSYGYPVRCVRGVSLTSDKEENTVPATASNFTLTVSSAGGDSWTLSETADASAAFTPSKTSGTGDGTFTVAVTENTTADRREASYTLTTASGLTAIITLKQVGVEPAIEINGLKWAKGNLIADGVNGAQVGAPTDGGLYFQFGSLIGYKGGNTASGGRGVGIPHGATTATALPDGKWWNQATAYSWANDAMVWPSEMSTKPTRWMNNLSSNTSTFTDYYFSYNVAPYAATGQKISNFSGLMQGEKANVGVGDPCRYYLGGAWRMPTAEDWGKLFNSVYANGPVGGYWPGEGWNWGYGTATKTVMAGIPSGVNSPTEGVGIYANTAATTAAAAKTDPNALFFPASGYRHYSNGSFSNVGRSGYSWSGSVYSATGGFSLSFNAPNVTPQNGTTRSYGFPVRCVQGVSLSSDKAGNTVPKEASSFTVTVAYTDGESWTLRETADASAAFTPSKTSGTGDGTFTVSVAENTTADPREASYTLSTASGLVSTITLKQNGKIAIEINGLLWAMGNLVADASVTPGSGVGANTNGTKVKIGRPEDGGLYFQFGSLIGYKGGNTASQGRGTGIPHGATTATAFPDNKYWNQATAYSWANDAMVWPRAYTNGAAAWPASKTTNDYYFGLQTAPYSSAGQKLSAYTNWESGGLVSTSVAVGDPCRYYLGGAWRMPTAEDWGKLFNSRYANGTVGGTWLGADQNWGYGTGTKTVKAGMTENNSPTEGIGLYANTAATTEAAAKADPGALFFPASGYRFTSNGSFYYVGRYGYAWSGSVYNASLGFYLNFNTTGVYPQNANYRSLGFPVRCVSEP